MGDNDDESGSAPKQPSNAAQRLDQVNSQIVASNTSKKRQPQRSKNDDPPADYSDILGQLESLRTMASTPDLKSRGYIKQKQAGKLWVRERGLQLLDEGSFHEVGSVAVEVKWKQLSRK